MADPRRTFACPGHQSYAGCKTEEECFRASAAEYVSAQAHHMPDSWREWFKRRFRLVDVVPYGVTLAKDADPRKKASKQRCETMRGEGPEKCGRSATHVGVDDDGNAWRFCSRCASMFEGGMVSMTEIRRAG